MPVSVTDIPNWEAYFAQHDMFSDITKDKFTVRSELNERLSLWKGDLTRVAADAIVNPTKPSLIGDGGGADGAIHRAAGPNLKKECVALNGCAVGKAKITKGYNLPAKHVIHVVSTRNKDEMELTEAYRSCFDLMMKHGLKSIVIPCVSTGHHGFHPEDATRIALRETRSFLEKNWEQVNRIIFCVFLNAHLFIYEEFMQEYFPVESATNVCHDFIDWSDSHHVTEEACLALSLLPGVTPAFLQGYFKTVNLVQRDSETYKYIAKYVHNGQVHGYCLKIHNIVRLSQEDVSTSYSNPFYLWHGTYKENVSSILASGFRKPASSSQMFGKGVYFADRASKSLNYCYKQVKKVNDLPGEGFQAFLLLCEVPLGEIFIATKSMHGLTKTPDGYNSVMCRGKKIRNPEGGCKLSGVQIPCGRTTKPKEFLLNNLEFNEYSVYDTEWIKVSFIVHVEVKMDRVLR